MTKFEEPGYSGNIKQRRSWLIKSGSLATWILFGLFVIGLTGITKLNGRYDFLQNNWLIVLFKLNVRSFNAPASMLSEFNFLDFSIMVLFGILFLALYHALYNVQKVWTSIAASLPFLGIILFLITHTAGRSGLLIGVLILSIVMFRSKVFGKVSSLLGVVASTLLFFAGDIGTTIFNSSIVIAILIAIGYLLWIVWIAQISLKLYKSLDQNDI